MSEQSRSNVIIGLVFSALGLLAVFVWIPLDSDSGLINKVRGRMVIGDALAPTIAGCFLLLGGLLLIIRERHAPNQTIVTRTQLFFITRIVIVIIVGVLAMRYSGPALADLVSLFRAEPIEYRLLRTTPGWRHVGYVVGGIIIVSGMIAVVEGKLTRRAVLTALIAVLVFIAVFDLPFEDLQLPPNGDV